MKKIISSLLVLFVFNLSLMADSTWPNHTSQYFNDVALNGPISATANTLALNSAYVFGTSGQAVYYSFIPNATGNLTDIIFRVSSYTGTWGSTDGHINFELRIGLSGTRIPATELAGSGNLTLDGTTTGWIHATGFNIGVVAGRVYELILADNDGGASNYATIVSGYTGSTGFSGDINNSLSTTTNGYNTSGTGVAQCPAVSVEVGSTWYGGCGVDTVATTASSTEERGIRFRPKENCTLVGVAMGNDPSYIWTNNTTYKLYADATAPGGTTLFSIQMTSTTVSSSTGVQSFVHFSSGNHYDLKANTWYRFVMKSSVATTVPRKCTVTGSPDANLLDAVFPFNGDFYWTASNSGAWVDDTTSVCTMGPYVLPLTGSTSSGGGFFIQ